MKYLIIGGTGALGHEVTRLLLNTPDSYITIFSRDENKQKKMANLFHDHRLRFVLGDARDFNALKEAMRGIDTVFHFAAAKHVEVVEDNPIEGIKTNLIGTINAVEAAKTCEVPYLVFCSTDKAVNAINAYGMTKALSEKVLLHQNEIQNVTRCMVYRWGNIIASTGSAYDIFKKDLLEHRKVYLTDDRMTRFFLTINQAARFMLDTYRTSAPNRVHIPPLKASSLLNFVKAVAEKHGVTGYEIVVTGMRKGEKLHEAIDYDEQDQILYSSDRFSQYTLEELKDLLP